MGQPPFFLNVAKLVPPGGLGSARGEGEVLLSKLGREEAFIPPGDEDDRPLQKRVPVAEYRGRMLSKTEDSRTSQSARGKSESREWIVKVASRTGRNILYKEAFEVST